MVLMLPAISQYDDVCYSCSYFPAWLFKKRLRSQSRRARICWGVRGSGHALAGSRGNAAMRTHSASSSEPPFCHAEYIMLRSSSCARTDSALHQSRSSVHFSATGPVHKMVSKLPQMHLQLPPCRLDALQSTHALSKDSVSEICRPMGPQVDPGRSSSVRDDKGVSTATIAVMALNIPHDPAQLMS